CQYFAYIEIWDLQEQQIFNEDRNVSLLWKAYEQVHLKNPKLAMNRVTHESQIFSVLHDLFSPKKLRD
ncbi:MAG: DUF444 family protein, partial [Rhizobiales bacterium]|nr:DUF444 family protein [Hyphomicrobiales bacterium]